MRGVITSFDPDSQTGTLRDEQGATYVFTVGDVQSRVVVVSGLEVDFVPSGSTATHIMVHTPPPAAHAAAASTDWTSVFTARAPSSAYDVRTALLSSTGRLRREHFWISFFFIIGLGVVLGCIPILGWFASLLLIWPNLAINIKRLHDLGKSGWLALIPFVGGLVAIFLAIISLSGAVLLSEGFDTADFNEGTAALTLFGGLGTSFLIALAANLGFLIWLGFTPGQRGPNAYGPDPKAI